jgi:hypothetical protein
MTSPVACQVIWYVDPPQVLVGALVKVTWKTGGLP